MQFHGFRKGSADIGATSVLGLDVLHLTRVRKRTNHVVAKASCCQDMCLLLLELRHCMEKIDKTSAFWQRVRFRIYM